MTKIRIGISGWTYPDWRGSFYPDHVIIKNELQFASRVFNSIEVNGTFYSLQKPRVFEKWYNETPAEFSFAIKAPKYVTHERRLIDVATPVANFLASGILALQEKLGPLLWQLPPHLPYDGERIKTFLELLPHNTKDATKVARGHSDWMAERCFLETDANRPLLHALEVRHHSYVNKEFFDLMKQHNVAIVVGDTAGKWPLIEEVTGSMIYIRLHGDEEAYPNGYTKNALKSWGEKITTFMSSSKIDSVYAFCDSDHKIAAPGNAMHLMQAMGVEWQHEQLPTVIKKAPAKNTSKATTNNSTVRKPTRKTSPKNKPLDKRRKVA